MKYILLSLILFALVYLFVIQSIVKTLKEKTTLEDDDKEAGELNNLDNIILTVATHSLEKNEANDNGKNDDTVNQKNDDTHQQNENVHQKNEDNSQNPSDNPKKSKKSSSRRSKKDTYLYQYIKAKTILDKNENNDLANS